MVNLRSDFDDAIRQNKTALHIAGLALVGFLFWNARKDGKKEFQEYIPRQERRTNTYSASDVRLPGARDYNAYYAPNVDPATKHRLFH